MDDQFKRQKKQVLAGDDLSRKGSIDAPIQDLVSFLNQQDSFVTTSSCSGRIILFEQNPLSSSGKQGCRWLFASHDKCKAEDVMAALGESRADAFFKFEPFVLHVKCCTLEDAQKLHADAVASGFRNSGLTVGRKGKIMTAVRSTHSLEAPVSKDGNVMVSLEYVEHLVKLANQKLDENTHRINRFFENVKNSLSRCAENSNNEETKRKSSRRSESKETTKRETKEKSDLNTSGAAPDEAVFECLDGLYEDT